MPKTEDTEREERRKKNRRFNTVLYIVAALLILTGVFIILRDQTSLFNRNTAEIPDVTFPPLIPRTTPTHGPSGTYDPGPTAAPTPEPTEEAPSPPVSIYFEGHNIAVAVVSVGINDKGEMDTVPVYNIAGWYELGAAPNSPGNCIIAGHNRYHGQKGLFSILHKGLEIGDRVCVTMENGNCVFYEVESIQQYRYDAVPASVMEQGGETRLTLITCLGDFDYDLQMSKTRVVAICKPIQ